MVRQDAKSQRRCAMQKDGRYGQNAAGKWVRSRVFREIDKDPENAGKLREFDTFEEAFEFEEACRLDGTAGRHCERKKIPRFTEGIDSCPSKDVNNDQKASTHGFHAPRPLCRSCSETSLPTRTLPCTSAQAGSPHSLRTIDHLKATIGKLKRTVDELKYKNKKLKQAIDELGFDELTAEMPCTSAQSGSPQSVRTIDYLPATINEPGGSAWRC